MSRLLVCAAALALLGGCGSDSPPPPPEWTLVLVSQPPVAVPVGIAGITLPVGVAIKVRLVHRSNAEVLLESQDPLVADVEETKVRGDFVVSGIAVGTTCLETLLQSGNGPCVPIAVVAQ